LRGESIFVIETERLHHQTGRFETLDKRYELPTLKLGRYWLIGES
jgi:hypothetical protein